MSMTTTTSRPAKTTPVNGKAAEEKSAEGQFSDDEYASIGSWTDAVQTAQEKFGTIIRAHEDGTFGDGFRVATEKDKKEFLTNRPLLLMEWDFEESRFDKSRVSVNVKLIARNDDGSPSKWHLSDGSGTGIAAQLREWTVANAGRKGGLALDSGLRYSEYAVDHHGKPMTRDQRRTAERNGDKIELATTFYLDTAARL